MPSRGTSVLLLVGMLAGCSAAPAATVQPSPTEAPATQPAVSPGPSPEPTTPPTPEPTQAVRTFTSDDGLLTIEVPPGAMPADVELTATAQGQDDLPPELAGIQIRSAFYRLEPDGLSFAEPVTVTRQSRVTDLGWDLATDGVPIITLALRTSDGSWEWLDEQELSLDGDLLIVSGKADHTSTVNAFGGTNFVRWEYDAPSPVDGSFTLDARVTYPPSATEWPVVDPPEPFTHTGVLSSLDHGMYTDALPGFYQGFVCDTPGTGEFGVRFEVGNLGAGNALWQQLDLPEPSTDIYLEALAICEAADSVPFQLENVCVRVFHDPLDDFVSYLRFLLWWTSELGLEVDYFVLTVEGANDGLPQQLRYDVERGGFAGELGLHAPGAKKITRFVAHLADGTTLDYTDRLIEKLGEEINVRYPQQDEFGTCPKR